MIFHHSKIRIFASSFLIDPSFHCCGAGADELRSRNSDFAASWSRSKKKNFRLRNTASLYIKSLLFMVFRQSKILIFLLNTVSPYPRFSRSLSGQSFSWYFTNQKAGSLLPHFFIKSPSNRCPAYPRFNRSLQVLAFHDIPPIKDSDSAVPVFRYWLKFIFL